MEIQSGRCLIGRYRVENSVDPAARYISYNGRDLVLGHEILLQEMRYADVIVSDTDRADGDVPRMGPRAHNVADWALGRARELARLKHPCLTALDDWFELDGACYLVTEYLDGYTLAELMAEPGRSPVPEDQALAWLGPIFDAVSYCHGEHVLHGDIRPANLLLLREGQSCLTAFSPLNTLLGCPPYMAPEATDFVAGYHCDIYSLGAVLYYLLTGKEPVAAEERCQGTPLLGLRELAPQVSPSVERAVLRALALLPAERPQSVAELRRALAGESGLGAKDRPEDVLALQGVLAASHWPLRFYDDFDEDRYGWDTGASDDEMSRGSQEIVHGLYRWQAYALSAFSWWSCPDLGPVGDLCLTVEVRQVSGERDAEYGLVFRAEGDDHYTFSIRDDGRFTCYLEHEGELTDLLEWAPCEAIRPQEANRLTVIGEGGRFTLLINDQVVGELEDGTLAQGQVGLLIGMERAGESAEFEFDRFELRAV